MIEEAPASVRRTLADRTQPPVGERFVLGRRVSLLVSAGVVSHTLWTSAAPALTYGLYAQEWHLSHTVTAGIFAIYPIGVVVMLVGLGGISDQIGRRATMLAGLFASLVGALLFAVAPDVWWVFAGRALMGIGVGLAASPRPPPFWSSAALNLRSMQPRSRWERRLQASPPLCCSAAP
jgi:MFS family permease